jgi:NAD(P)-dependent dehydrogenase (short-subunit alcohol dehydrogenase family)
MKILLIGANGTIGKAVRKELEQRHEVISAGRKEADVAVDLTSPDRIKEMYRKVGQVDAVVCAAGATYFGPLTELTPEQNELSIQSKLKGQVNLVLLGHEHVRDGGSFTLTTGIIMEDPIMGGVSAAMVGGAIKAFVESAAFELPRRIRINHVSPTVLAESIEKYGPYFPGFEPVSASRVAKAYQKSVEGIQSGKTYRVY